MTSHPTRRTFLKSATIATTATLASGILMDKSLDRVVAAPESSESPKETYETHAKGIRILPGEWRPHYPWEHIVWVSPSWPSQDYIWLDFPEAIFTSQGLIYLSHVNPPIHTVFHDLPKIPWEKTDKGIRFNRELPNGVVFGGSVQEGEGSTVDLELHLKNGTSEPLNNISLQTCAFLRAIKEFADYTRDNKYVHVPQKGWIPLEEARSMEDGNENYRVGWRTRGNPVADFPAMVTVSNQAERLVAMTWFDDTLSMVSNPNHPCMHADPKFEDLEPGEVREVHGKLIFFEGPLEEFVFENYLPN
ncbi:MAG: hypothetical protein H6751_15285 [Candidatus Omnitrophica bacterium]|nr:hypothetical protein [Candidatus Omnitrophota bacterium]